MQKIIALLALTSGVAFADRVMVPEDPGPTLPKRLPPAPSTPNEIAQLGKLISGTWKCDGEMPKLTIKLVLGDAWIEMTSAHFTSDMTYDAIAKQWTMITRTASSYTIATSLGEQQGVWTWSGTQHTSLSKTKLRFWTDVDAHLATCTRS